MLRARRSVRSSTATRSTFVIGSSMRGLRMIIRIIHHIKSECALRYAFYDLSGMTSALNFTRMAVPARTRARIGGIEAACGASAFCTPESPAAAAAPPICRMEGFASVCSVYPPKGEWRTVLPALPYTAPAAPSAPRMAGVNIRRQCAAQRLIVQCHRLDRICLILAVHGRERHAQGFMRELAAADQLRAFARALIQDGKYLGRRIGIDGIFQMRAILIGCMNEGLEIRRGQCRCCRPARWPMRSGWRILPFCG